MEGTIGTIRTGRRVRESAVSGEGLAHIHLSADLPPCGATAMSTAPAPPRRHPPEIEAAQTHRSRRGKPPRPRRTPSSPSSPAQMQPGWVPWGSTACVIAITPKVLVSNTSRTVAIGVASKTPSHRDARIVDEHVDGPTRLDRGRDALGLRHVERHHTKLFGSRQNVRARVSHGGDHVPTLRVEVARGLESIARRATSNKHSLHGDTSTAKLAARAHRPGPVKHRDLLTIAKACGTIYNVESIFHLRASSLRCYPQGCGELRLGRPYERPPLGSCHAASAAHRVLETHHRRRSLGRRLLGLRPPELLRRAQGKLPSRGRRSACPHARGRRLRPPAGDSGLHHVWLRAGEARAVRPERDVGATG